MAVKYLDNAGTQYLVNKIKAIDGKIPTESQITTMITTALNTYKEGIVTIVESLPQTGEEGKLYLLVDPSDSDVYIIYTWEDNAFKRMGSKTFTLTVDSALSDTSTNPVQNKVVKSALDGKANSSHTHGSITNDGKLGTASRVVITGTDKKIGISTVTTTQLGYLSGVTSAIQTQLDGKSATGHTHTAGDVAGLATVATTGSYTDLTDKPTINDSTITIQKNGSTVDTFTTNGSAKTINITVPTKTSDLTNDSNFVDTSNSAVASGITSAKVTDYDTHIEDTDIHVTTADKNRWNNQTYVLRYSSTTLVASSTNSNSLLDNTDNLKVGDKVIDNTGNIYVVTAIDTANSTFTIGTSLIDLAQDSDVVHKSGNETVSGIKSFTDDTYIKSLNFTNEVPSPSSSSSSIMPIITTITYGDSSPSQSARLNFRVTADGIKSLYPHENNQYALGLQSRKWSEVRAIQYYYGSSDVEFSTKFVTTDTAQDIEGNKNFKGLLTTMPNDTIWPVTASTTDDITYLGANAIHVEQKSSGKLTDLSNGAWSVAELGVGCFFFRFNNGTDIRYKHFGQNTVNRIPVVSGANRFINDVTPNENNKYSLGTSTNKWDTINGLEPSALGMPDLDNGIDISSYITVGNTDDNYYTPPVNGWLWARMLGNGLAIQQGNFGSYGNYVADSTTGDKYVEACLLVTKDVQATIRCRGITGIVSAKFYPCQGNV